MSSICNYVERHNHIIVFGTWHGAKFGAVWAGHAYGSLVWRKERAQGSSFASLAVGLDGLRWERQSWANCGAGADRSAGRQRTAKGLYTAGQLKPQASAKNREGPPRRARYDRNGYCPSPFGGRGKPTQRRGSGLHGSPRGPTTGSTRLPPTPQPTKRSHQHQHAPHAAPESAGSPPLREQGSRKRTPRATPQPRPQRPRLSSGRRCISGLGQ